MERLRDCARSLLLFRQRQYGRQILFQTPFLRQRTWGPSCKKNNSQNNRQLRAKIIFHFRRFHLLTNEMILAFKLAYVRLVSMNCVIEVYLYLVNPLLFSQSGRLLSRAQSETTTSVSIFKTITITAKEDFYKC